LPLLNRYRHCRRGYRLLLPLLLLHHQMLLPLRLCR
jgi:hypothetical protein